MRKMLILLLVQPEHPRGLAGAHSLDTTRPPDPRVHLHPIHPPPSSQSNPDRRLYAVPFWSATAGSTGRFSGGLLRRRSQPTLAGQSAIDLRTRRQPGGGCYRPAIANLTRRRQPIHRLVRKVTGRGGIAAVARHNLVRRRNPGYPVIGRIASRPCERCSSCCSWHFCIGLSGRWLPHISKVWQYASNWLC